MTTLTDSTELTLVDTNVLVYAHDQGNPYHETCRRLLLEAGSLCVVPQTIAEFFVIVTSPRRVTRPRSPQNAVAAIERVLQNPALVLLPVPRISSPDF